MGERERERRRRREIRTWDTKTTKAEQRMRWLKTRDQRRVIGLTRGEHRPEVVVDGRKRGNDAVALHPHTDPFPCEAKLHTHGFRGAEVLAIVALFPRRAAPLGHARHLTLARLADEPPAVPAVVSPR